MPSFRNEFLKICISAEKKRSTKLWQQQRTPRPRNPQKQPKIETKTPNEGQNKGVKFHIQGDFAEMASWNGRPKPAYLENCQREARMFWLAQYIQSLNEPITEMMRRCGIDLTCLRYIFVKDDIKISQIFKIASGTDGQIYWNITKKKEE